ncbi:MAG TPA: hypothetical protein VD968_08955 [Pyrinomonadaceae bacterium]|nr:hypothetical protein [Pyrinomonadaceae bacterium]
MKTVVAKTLVMLAGVVLVLSLVAAGLLVGARAVEGVESTEARLLFVTLALGGALFSGSKGFTRGGMGEREGQEPGARAHRARADGHAFLRMHGI